MRKEKKKELWRVVKFVLFSASAGVIQIGLFTALNELCRWSYWPCYLIALVAALFVQLVMTFVQNKEELFLDDCADYCHRNLIAKMKNVNLIEPEA